MSEIEAEAAGVFHPWGANRRDAGRRETGDVDALYDVRPLQQLREIDPSGAFLRRWIQLFLTDAPQKIAEIEVAMDAGITRPLVRSAHSLKSYAGWLGSQELWRVCHRLEQEARAGAMTECRRLLPDLRRNLREFQDWLTSYLGAEA